MVHLARRQHGVVTIQQIRQEGVTAKTLRTKMDKGEWTTAVYGVVRVGGAPATWHSQVMALVLGAGPGAVASHRTAARLWGLDGQHARTPEIAVPRRRKTFNPAGARIHSSTDLHLVRPTRRAQIPTTPVARTLLDLGAVLPRPLVHLAVDDARRRQLTDWDALLDTLVLHARRGRRGSAALRAILEQHSQEVVATDSGFERLVVAALARAGLPRPELQHEVTVAGQRYRLDLAYPTARVAIELDGSHHLLREVWERDRARQNALVLAGWTVLRFTWRDYKDRRAALVREVRAVLSPT